MTLGFFYVLFSGSYLSAHTKQNLSIHSISENGRKPVKKISASATVLLTLKVEVQSPYNRITISYNRKGHRAFAVFLLSIFVGKCRRAVSDMRCRSFPRNSTGVRLCAFLPAKYGLLQEAASA